MYGCVGLLLRDHAFCLSLRYEQAVERVPVEKRQRKAWVSKRYSISFVEQRLNDPHIILNSFILSWTPYSELKWGQTQKQLEELHVLFMNDDRNSYINELLNRLGLALHTQKPVH